MKLLLALMLLPTLAHAGSWFQFEAGIGAAKTSDMGDGVWYQAGVPHAVKLTTPAYLAGATGEMYARENWSLRYHVDYVYIGSQSASCLCVGDNQYNANTHTASVPGYAYFNGQGHVQGVALTLQPTYTWRGVELGAEAGYWAYWNTWHETVLNAGQTDNLDHKTGLQFAPVFGANITYNSWSASYRYYKERPSWRPVPGIATGTHMLMLTKRF